MPLTPLQPLAPLSPASGLKLHSFQPLVISINDPAFSGGGYGDLSGGYGNSGVTDYTNPFAPATGPTMGGNFPGGGCDPSIDPLCGGCDPSIDPFCDSGGGTIPIVFGGGGGGGGGGAQAQPVSSGSAGGTCGGFPFTTGWLSCWLERLVILALGIAAIVGGIYLLKPSLIDAPVRAAIGAVVAESPEPGQTKRVRKK
jgi:hypothetical protein